MISETIKNFFLQLKDVFLNFNFFSDTLDILVVALIVYVVIVQMRKTQAIQVVKGIVLVAVMYAVVSLLGMNTSTYLFSKLFSDILIIFVILFSAEIRQALELLGKRRFGTRFSLFEQSSESLNVDMINCICRACGAMGRNKVGSLILIQRETMLGDYMKQAVPLDAQITFETLCSIFYPKAPLHDGAIIVKNGRIVAARCVVPLKNDREIVENVGTRHRAALEASLNSDCIAVVTSEETGMISIAVDGQLIRGFTDSQLREELGKYLLRGNDKKKTPMVLFAKHKKNDGEVSSETEKTVKSESKEEKAKPAKAKKEKKEKKKKDKNSGSQGGGEASSDTPADESPTEAAAQADTAEQTADEPESDSVSFEGGGEQGAPAAQTDSTENGEAAAENTASGEGTAEDSGEEVPDEKDAGTKEDV